MLPPPRATRGPASPMSDDLPVPKAQRAPRVGDRVDILWEDRGQYYRGTLMHRVKRKTYVFQIRYDDGDLQQLDLNNFQWLHATKEHESKREHILIYDALEFIPGRSDSDKASAITQSFADLSSREVKARVLGASELAKSGAKASNSRIVSKSICKSRKKSERKKRKTELKSINSSDDEIFQHRHTIISPVSVARNVLTPNPFSLSQPFKRMEKSRSQVQDPFHGRKRSV